MMRRYEMVLVAAPNVAEEALDQQVTGLEQLIAEMGGRVLKVDRWGRRKLAYPIRKFSEGNYTLLLYDSEPEVEKELLRRLRLSDSFIRFLSVRADHERPPTEEEKAALEERRREHLRRAAERAAQAAATASEAPGEETGAPDGDADAPADVASDEEEEPWPSTDGEPAVDGASGASDAAPEEDA